MSSLENKIEEIAKTVEKRLAECLKTDDNDIAKLYEAMSYSTFGKGKRIRPFLVIAVCDMLSGNIEEALTYAAAIEMVHTYSLIHDDLPCMDNDDLRRGRPTCHIVYGESRAVLAGDGLLTKAFEIIAKDDSIAAEHKIKAISMISELSGPSGMIGGQEMDVAYENQAISYETMVKIHNLKTVDLIKCACRLGAISASADDKTIGDLDNYAEGIGRVFQLTDDLLDVSSTDKELGKTVHSDEKNHKTTYLSFMPTEIAMQLADVITEKAVNSLASYDRRSTLCELALYLKDRKK